MKDPVRWGVLGASNFAREQMVPAIHRRRRCGLCRFGHVGSCEGAHLLAAFAPGLKVHDSYDACWRIRGSRPSIFRCPITCMWNGR